MTELEKMSDEDLISSLIGATMMRFDGIPGRQSATGTQDSARAELLRRLIERNHLIAREVVWNMTKSTERASMIEKMIEQWLAKPEGERDYTFALHPDQAAELLRRLIAVEHWKT